MTKEHIISQGQQLVFRNAETEVSDLRSASTAQQPPISPIWVSCGVGLQLTLCYLLCRHRDDVPRTTVGGTVRDNLWFLLGVTCWIVFSL